ncbi:MAG: class C sortase, partial [Clostridium sp.]
KGYYQRNAIKTYNNSVISMEDTKIEEELNKAREYNTTLYEYNSATKSSTNSSILQEYEDILNVGDGIMGSIEIPRISVNLPIYHGTSDEVLSSGVGHVLGSSLPIGGADTRSLLTAHRGLPNSKLFTRLDEIIEGDLFFIRVQNNTLAYKVNKIEVINPEELEKLKIKENEDLISLITCTPYGINTHRLVVTGERVPFDKEEYENIDKKVMSIREIAFTTIPLAFLGLVIGLKVKDKKINKENKRN